MAAPLGQVVFKVPELGKQGYALEQQEQALQEKKRKERDTELYRTGGEKAFNDNAYMLQGQYKSDTETLFAAFEKAGERYEQTGDPSALRESKQIAGLIKQKVNDYNTQVGIPLSAANKVDAEEGGWNNYVGDRESFNNDMNNLLNPQDITGSKYENGNLMYQIGGKWVPEGATPRGQRQPNPANSVVVQKATKIGKNVAPSSWENDHRFLTINADDAETAGEAVVQEFRYELADNPELQVDVALSYAIAERELDPRNISSTQQAEIMKLYANNDSFREKALALYETKLKKISANRFAAKAGFGADVPKEDVFIDDVASTETEKTTETEEATEKEVEGSNSILPDIEDDMPELPPTAEERQARGEARIDAINKEKTPGQVQGPPTAEEVVVQNISGMEETKFDEVSEAEETPFERIPASGVSDTQLTVKVDGKEDIVMERTLPSYYTDNLLLFEGGVSTDEGDAAAGADRNKNAPIVDGKKAHTNRGVTYDKFESWAKSIGLPKSNYKERFLNLTEADALAVAESEALKIGANNFKEPALSALFTQNTWGGGSPFITPGFKNSFSDEYKAVSVFLNKNGIKLSSSQKISPEEASQIDALYRKNPEKFINDYFDAWMIAHTRMALKVKDNENVMKLGKGAMVPTYMINRNGWYNRANDLKKSLAEQAGVTYTPVSPYNKTRKYIKSGDKFVLVEERGGEFVPVGSTDWFDSYEPIK
jgi:hypothetical protein